MSRDWPPGFSTALPAYLGHGLERQVTVPSLMSERLGCMREERCPEAAHTQVWLCPWQQRARGTPQARPAHAPVCPSPTPVDMEQQQRHARRLEPNFHRIWKRLGDESRGTVPRLGGSAEVLVGSRHRGSRAISIAPKAPARQAPPGTCLDGFLNRLAVRQQQKPVTGPACKGCFARQQNHQSTWESSVLQAFQPGAAAAPCSRSRDAGSPDAGELPAPVPKKQAPSPPSL